MCATIQRDQPIVVDGWIWGVNEKHSREAASRCTELCQLIKMADDLLGNTFTADDELISLLVMNEALPFNKANQLAKSAQQQQGGVSPTILCARKDATPEALEEWAEAGDLNWIRSIANNPNTKLDTLKKLTRHSDPNIVCIVLSCGRLPQETIDGFASREEQEIKQEVARATTTLEIIRAMTINADYLLSLHICLNPHTPTELINELGRKHLAAVVSIPYRVTDPAVLRNLCDKYGKKYEVYLTNKPMPADGEWRKNWPLVVNGHCWGLNEPESLAAAREVKDQKLVARMADDILSKRLDLDKFPTLSTRILEQLVENEALPIEIAKQLPALTSDWGCRNQLLTRSDVTPEILDEFADHPGQYVVNNIVHNDRVKPETVARIALNGDPEEVSEALKSSRLPGEVLDKFATSENFMFRRLVACGTNNPEVLAKLVFDTEPWVRASAVENPKIEMAVLEKVALRDENLDVAAIATERLTNQEILSQVYNRLEVENNAKLARAIANNKYAHEGIRVGAALLCPDSLKS